MITFCCWLFIFLLIDNLRQDDKIHQNQAKKKQQFRYVITLSWKSENKSSFMFNTANDYPPANEVFDSRVTFITVQRQCEHQVWFCLWWCVQIHWKRWNSPIFSYMLYQNAINWSTSFTTEVVEKKKHPEQTLWSAYPVRLEYLIITSDFI